MANNPEVFGPDAAKLIESIESNNKEPGIEQGSGAVAESVAQLTPGYEKEFAAEFQQHIMFPFGLPEHIDWTTADKAGLQFITELNKRPWVKTVEYCSGHPLNRPIDEVSDYYPDITGEDVYEEINMLDNAFVRGLIPDQYFRARKQELRESGQTRFYVSMNVYNLTIFMNWTKHFAMLLMIATGSDINPLVVRYHPMRPGVNFSLHWDYWTVNERDIIHTLALDSLNQFPI